MPDSTEVRAEDLRGYVDYLRDLGIYDLYACGTPATDDAVAAWAAQHLRQEQASAKRAGPQPTRPAAAPVPPPAAGPSPFERSVQRSAAPTAKPLSAGGLRPAPPQITITPPLAAAPRPASPPQPLAALSMETDDAHSIVAGEMAPVPFNLLAPPPAASVPPADRAAALHTLRAEIGDCTRCPLAYAGRHTIVFGDGDPNARLLFVGEGPGADEDETGIPFVGKAGQLLNNMIGAMGLKRESVYIANVVKCRPPKNRTPEPVEATTCSQFLLRQIDIVQPEVIVALGATAATYLLGVKQSLSSLRGQWFDVRGAKCAVTYHPAYLLRDPRQKGEAWKDLQRVMVEMKLTPPPRG